MSDYISVKEASEILGLSHQQTLNRVKRGKIPGKKFGWVWMIKREDLKKDKKTEK